MEDLDEQDRHIIRLLAGDGRMSFTDLAKATSLSTSAAHQRVRRLEQRGVITGYAALVNSEQAGLPLTAFVSVSPIDPADPDDIADKLAPLAAIESAYSVAGDQNYVLKVRVASPGALETLLSEIRSTAHVTTRTTVVLSVPFEHRPPPL